MIRLELIERIKRQIYGGFPTDDAEITDNLVNKWIIDGTALAAKKNYTDNFQLEGVGFLNNSFYSTFKGLTFTEDERFLYKTTLPSLPLGIGAVDSISRAIFKNLNSTLSFPAVILSESQVAIQRQMRKIPNKISCYPEGKFFFAITPILLNNYTLTITIVSAGDDMDLGSELNIPSDYIPIIIEYVKAQLGFERMQPVDANNDGQDAIRTT